MGSDIQLISDGDGLAVIADPAAVELFPTSKKLTCGILGCLDFAQSSALGLELPSPHPRSRPILANGFS